MVKWEYKVLEYHYRRNSRLHFQERLNILGEQGWELIEVIKKQPEKERDIADQNDITVIYTLKRQKEEKVKP